jgi:trigger factor
MKTEVKSKKGLRIILSVVVDKKNIQEKMDQKLNELQKEVALKGFRPGKVPPALIKSQFGKSIYGEVVDKILRDTSSKAIDEQKLKVAGQPKIDLKQFEDRNDSEKATIGNQVVFDYSATVDGNKFEGSEGKGVQLELGKDLFLKGFDQQLIGVKKGETKLIDAVLPANHPKKELANKKTKFECKILNVKKSKENKIDDNFAKMMGAKDIKDLKSLIEKQISSQYSQALNAITKKEILDQIEKNHQVELPQNLIDQEISMMTKNLKPDEKEKHKQNNEKLAKSKIKLTTKEISSKEAEKIISEFNKPNLDDVETSKTKSSDKNKSKSKKISKK